MNPHPTRRLTALLILLLVAPLGGASHSVLDSCYRTVDTNHARVCVVLPVPPAPAGLPPPAQQSGAVYYVYVSPEECLADRSNCRGTGTVPHGVPLPSGGSRCVCFLGVLWEESNGIAGLQRALAISDGVIHHSDRQVLV